MTEKIRIEPLVRSHDRESFDCGIPALDQYLRQYARQSGDIGLGRTFVAVSPSEKLVLGYYTVASSSLSFQVVPAKLPRYPVPVVLLARLAVDRNAQGSGIGTLMLLDCFRRSLQISSELGIYAIEVDAKTDSAKEFYAKYGFSTLNDSDLHMYISMDTIRRSGLLDSR